MAAIDPTAEPEHTGTTNGGSHPRATLKLIYDRSSQPDDDDDDSKGSMDGQDFLKALMEGQESDEQDEDDEDDESSSDDEEVNGGPSDPARSSEWS